MDKHKVVTQFVPIAAVKTDEAHTCDLKKQTSPMMENLFSSNQPMLGLVLKFSEDFLSPFDWAMILFHESSFSVAGIIREL